MPFYKQRTCARGHLLAKYRRGKPGHTYCRACKTIKHHAARKRDLRRFARYRRTHRLKKLYGLTDAGYSKMMLEQGECCGLCCTDIPGTKGWAVDHDHQTGRVRGVLCQACNKGLGCFKDSTDLLLRAVQYLES